MKRVLKVELSKAFGNKFFIIGLAVAMLFAFLSALYNIQSFQQEMQTYEQSKQLYSELINPNMPLLSLFNHWICEDFDALATSTFFFLYPIISALTYGWSLFDEKKSGYIKNIISRTTKADYYFSKYIATFLSGGAVISIPVIFNFLLVSMFIPAVKPDVFYDIGWTVRQASMFSECFFTFPFLYVFLRTMMVFLFSGTIATLSLSLALLIKNRFAVIIVPFLAVLALHYGQNVIALDFEIPELSPIYIVSANGFKTKTLAALFEIIVITIAVICLIYRKGVKKDVY